MDPSDKAPQPNRLFDLDTVDAHDRSLQEVAIIEEYSRDLGAFNPCLAYWDARDPADPFTNEDLQLDINSDSHPLDVAVWVESVAEEAADALEFGGDTNLGHPGIRERLQFLKHFYAIEAEVDDTAFQTQVAAAVAARDAYMTPLLMATELGIDLHEARDRYHATMQDMAAGQTRNLYRVMGVPDPSGNTRLRELWLARYNPSQDTDTDISKN